MIQTLCKIESWVLNTLINSLVPPRHWVEKGRAAS